MEDNLIATSRPCHGRNAPVTKVTETKTISKKALSAKQIEFTFYTAVHNVQTWYYNTAPSDGRSVMVCDTLPFKS